MAFLFFLAVYHVYSDAFGVTSTMMDRCVLRLLVSRRTVSTVRHKADVAGAAAASETTVRLMAHPGPAHAYYRNSAGTSEGYSPAQRKTPPGQRTCTVAQLAKRNDLARLASVQAYQMHC